MPCFESEGRGGWGPSSTKFSSRWRAVVLPPCAARAQRPPDTRIHQEPPLYFGRAEGAASEEARELLRQDGREGTAHAHRLKKAIEILTGEPYTIPTLDENPYGKPPAMGPVTLELLSGLIQAEYGGDKLYQTYAANEPNPEVAALLLQNGREETRHGQRVEKAIALLGR